MKIQFNGYFFTNEKNKAIEASNIFGKHFKISEKFYFTVHSVSEKHSQSLNKDYFKINKSTDVLSFPLYESHNALLKLDPNKEEDLGDMFIVRSIVKKNAENYQKLFVEELQYIIIHGLMHLIGYSHNKEIELRKVENRIMKMVWNES